MAKRPATPKYRSFRLEKRIRHPYHANVPKFRRLFMDSLRLIKRHKLAFAKLALVHVVLVAIFVPLQEGFDVQGYRDAFTEVFGGRFSAISIVLGEVARSTVSSIDQAAAMYGSVITIIMTLAYLWVLRHAWARKAYTVKDAFYKGMYPVIPFVLVLFVMAIQLIPLAITNSFLATLRANALITSGAEAAVFYALLFVVLLFCGYFVTSSAMAAYAVSLPDMTPMAALRAARKLVHFRRAVVFTRMAQFLLVICTIGLLLLALVIQFVPGLTFWFITFASIAVLPLLHAYFYSLYRGLL